MNRSWRTAALVLGALAALAQPASAFYWVGWPGSGVTPPPSITQQPSIQVKETTPPTTHTEPPEPEPPVEPPKSVPEPGTLIVAAIGLGVVAAARRVRSRNKSAGAQA